ncbi:putative disease resistance protein RGA4 [Morella rubra]|uniref:Putative disease resistance protein RGA4 n=1 Tax=Morella rubra TaxID=262757 RepID=A0A6A1WQM2_9ROSI|nr:putative disease resistance protein RGA4 [Morella rubra]
MAEGLLFSIAEGILGKLGSRALQELGLLWGVKDELEKLQDTVSTIKAVLLDAEEKRAAGNNAVKLWLERLDDVVYKADDLLDDFSTEGLLREMMTQGRNKTKQVRIFFSKSNQLAYRLKMARKIKKIREKLDAIQADLGEQVIGREDDKKAVIELLMDSNIEENVSILAIVGIGGLGKTTLAKHVFNDEKIKESFEVKMWQMAFEKGEEPENSRIVAIGKEILEKCVGVPLAIRIIGRLLNLRNSETEWLSFKTNELLRIKQNDILPTLKLSYDKLPPHLKHCFAYCSLFPKDSLIPKSILVKLWTAQGFIHLSDQDQCFEDVGNEYFMDLLWRSFFQEAELDEYGDVISCKMHDLMHDLAVSVAGSLITTFDCEKKAIDVKTRHLWIDDRARAIFETTAVGRKSKHMKRRGIFSLKQLLLSLTVEACPFLSERCKRGTRRGLAQDRLHPTVQSRYCRGWGYWRLQFILTGFQDPAENHGKVIGLCSVRSCLVAEKFFTSAFLPLKKKVHLFVVTWLFKGSVEWWSVHNSLLPSQYWDCKLQVGKCQVEMRYRNCRTRIGFKTTQHFVLPTVVDIPYMVLTSQSSDAILCQKQG